MAEEKKDTDVPVNKKIISKESAQDVFDGILEYYDIDFEDIVNDQGKDGAKTVQNKFIRAIMSGRIETNIHDDAKKGFQIIQHTRPGETVVYNEYNLKAARESAKAKDSTSAQFCLLASMSGLGVPYFENVKNFRGPDLKLAEYISILFLL